MLLYELADCIKLGPAESAGSLQRDRIQPEFRNHVLAPHMNMWRLTAVKGDKEQPIRTCSQNRRHLPPVQFYPGYGILSIFLSTSTTYPLIALATSRPPRAAARGSRLGHSRASVVKWHSDPYFTISSPCTLFTQQGRRYRGVDCSSAATWPRMDFSTILFSISKAMTRAS